MTGAYLDVDTLSGMAPLRVATFSLGSNLGDRFDNLQGATNALRATPGLKIVAISSVYETTPVGLVDLERRVDLERGRLETLLKVLDVDGAAAWVGRPTAPAAGGHAAAASRPPEPGPAGRRPPGRVAQQFRVAHSSVLTLHVVQEGT